MTRGAGRANTASSTPDTPGLGQRKRLTAASWSAGLPEVPTVPKDPDLRAHRPLLVSVHSLTIQTPSWGCRSLTTQLSPRLGKVMGDPCLLPCPTLPSESRGRRRDISQLRVPLLTPHTAATSHVRAGGTSCVRGEAGGSSRVPSTQPTVSRCWAPSPQGTRALPAAQSPGDSASSFTLTVGTLPPAPGPGRLQGSREAGDAAGCLLSQEVPEGKHESATVGAWRTCGDGAVIPTPTPPQAFCSRHHCASWRGLRASAGPWCSRGSLPPPVSPLLSPRPQGLCTCPQASAQMPPLCGPLLTL